MQDTDGAFICKVVLEIHSLDQRTIYDHYICDELQISEMHWKEKDKSRAAGHCFQDNVISKLLQRAVCRLILCKHATYFNKNCPTFHITPLAQGWNQKDNVTAEP